MGGKLFSAVRDLMYLRQCAVVMVPESHSRHTDLCIVPWVPARPNATADGDRAMSLFPEHLLYEKQRVLIVSHADQELQRM
jgi:hypothetical protein